MQACEQVRSGELVNEIGRGQAVSEAGAAAKKILVSPS